MNDPSAMYRGSIIRRTRKTQNMTLHDLSHETGLSLSFISQVERGLTNPSINSLRKIALALGIPVSSFFEEGSSSYGPVVRKNERGVLVNTDSRLTYQLLSLNHNHRIEFLLTRLEIGGTSAEYPMTHKGEEAALMLQGECRIELGDDIYDLKEGDSIYITENTPHRLTNTGGVPLMIVSAISPPGF
ncbi:MAG: cupin domain-containing protein [Desulfobacteraceae bacterium]|nr:cupin domain-containing protein [Desulfobacteraceae bacterium]